MRGEQASIPRRQFLGRLCVAGTAGLLAAGPEVGAAGMLTVRKSESLGARGLRLDRVTARVFEEHLGSPFRVRVGSGATVAVKLAEVKTDAFDPIRPGHLARRRSFSLLFRAAGGLRLAQGTYRLEHRVLGGFDIFLVPVGPYPEGARFEAVFG